MCPSPSPSVHPSAHSEVQRGCAQEAQAAAFQNSAVGGQWAACCEAGVYLVVCVLMCLLVTRVLKCRIIFTESLLYQENGLKNPLLGFWPCYHLKLTFNFSNCCWCLIT